MADALGSKLSNVSLRDIEEGDNVVFVNEGCLDDVVVDNSLCLVGKMMLRKPFSLEAVKNSFMRAWQLSHHLVIKELRDRLFLFRFSSSAEREIVVDRCPLWVQFHGMTGNLMFSKVGALIGEKLGSVLEVELWIDFKYERLPDFCYVCGKFSHLEQDCDRVFKCKLATELVVKEFGPTLKTDNFSPSVSLHSTVPASFVCQRAGMNRTSSTNSSTHQLRTQGCFVGGSISGKVLPEKRHSQTLARSIHDEKGDSQSSHRVEFVPNTQHGLTRNDFSKEWGGMVSIMRKEQTDLNFINNVCNEAMKRAIVEIAKDVAGSSAKVGAIGVAKEVAIITRKKGITNSSLQGMNKHSQDYDVELAVIDSLLPNPPSHTIGDFAPLPKKINMVVASRVGGVMGRIDADLSQKLVDVSVHSDISTKKSLSKWKRVSCRKSGGVSGAKCSSNDLS
ncbi:hypothetical protein PTKIN_Ptkin14bG0087900 [Pterospermum kingtungense]